MFLCLSTPNGTSTVSWTFPLLPHSTFHRIYPSHCALRCTRNLKKKQKTNLKHSRRVTHAQRIPRQLFIAFHLWYFDVGWWDIFFEIVFFLSCRGKKKKYYNRSERMWITWKYLNRFVIFSPFIILFYSILYLTSVGSHGFGFPFVG